MEEMSRYTARERPSEVHTVWIGEKDRIASFHEIDTYEPRTFQRHDFFIQYLRSLQERGFRFQ